MGHPYNSILRIICNMNGIPYVTLQIISFGLAVFLGLLAFGLVKRTADEFDRWYEIRDGKPRLIYRPAMVIGLLVAACTAVFFSFVR